MAKKFKVKKLSNGEYEITHPDGHVQRLAKGALIGSVKKKKNQIIKANENLDYKKELLKAINQAK